MYIITNSLQELMFDAILDTVGISGNCQITLKIQLGVVQDNIMFLFFMHCITHLILLEIWFICDNKVICKSLNALKKKPCKVLEHQGRMLFPQRQC